jgi:hypothetical protein
MKNSDQPINAIVASNGFITSKDHLRTEQLKGLTKREYACIKLGIPKTGDPELDEIIKKAERKRIAGLAMQGILSNNRVNINEEENMSACIKIADEFLKQIEK